VDVGDADTVALAMIAARRLGFRVTRTHLQSTANGLEPIARVPIELAIEMIELREPPLYA
jgi:predicted aspartyl protease